EGNAGRPIRIVFDGDDRGPHVVLVPLEIDEAIHPFVSAATEAGAGQSVIVPAAFFGLREQERFFRFLFAVGEFGEITDRALPPTRRRRFIVTDTHDSSRLSFD